MLRIILNILLFFIIISSPWWVSVLFAVLILYYLKSFNEIVLFGLVMDIYYGKFSSVFHISEYRFTVLFLILLLLSFFIKKRLKFYSK
jgi:hypothetical protein